MFIWTIGTILAFGMFLSLTCRFLSITHFWGKSHFFKLSGTCIYFVEVYYEKPLCVWSAPAVLFFPENRHFWILETCQICKNHSFRVFFAVLGRLMRPLVPEVSFCGSLRSSMFAGRVGAGGGGGEPENRPIAMNKLTTRLLTPEGSAAPARSSF